MITRIKRMLENRLKRDRLIIAHHETLEAVGNLMGEQGKTLIVALERMESLFVAHARTSRIVADLIPSKADRETFLAEVAKLESASEAMEMHIANFKKAMNNSN